MGGFSVVGIAIAVCRQVLRAAAGYKIRTFFAHCQGLGPKKVKKRSIFFTFFEIILDQALVIGGQAGRNAAQFLGFGLAFAQIFLQSRG